jgi:hypothetical protein
LDQLQGVKMMGDQRMKKVDLNQGVKMMGDL